MEFLLLKKIAKILVNLTSNSSIKANSSTQALMSKYCDNGSNPIRALRKEDLSCSFKVGVIIFDDILLRCRHYKSETERVSLFRVFFHTSFVQQNLLRFTIVLV